MKIKLKEDVKTIYGQPYVWCVIPGMDSWVTICVLDGEPVVLVSQDSNYYSVRELTVCEIIQLENLKKNRKITER